MNKILLSILSLLLITNVHSQCEIIATPNTTSFDCNDSVTIDLVGFSQVFITDTFSFGGPTSGAWTTTSGAEYGTPYINSNQGGAYFWMGPSAVTPTSLTTTPFDFSGISGGQICFEFVYADGIQGMHEDGSIPEQPDEYDEGIELQFNTGSGWQSIVYYAPNGDILAANPQTSTPGAPIGGGPFEVWTEVCIDIPAFAIGNPAVQFQWLQDNNSGACCDHWGIDNVYIVATDNTYNAFFINNSTMIGPTPTSVVVTPTSDSSFFFFYSNNTTFCYDTVNLTPNPTDAGPDVTVSCSTLGIPITVEGVSPWSEVTWSPALGLDDSTLISPYANPTADQMYVVETDCGIDSTFVNVVPIFEPSITASQDSICVGDNTLLTASSNISGVVYTYSWQPLTVEYDTAMSTNAFPSINTTYYLEMVSDSGCVRNDSVTIYVGAVPKTINYIGDMRVCRGDSTQVTVIPTQPTFFDDFELGANPSIWSNVVNGLPGLDCGSVSGNALHFNGVGERGVQLNAVDATLGGTITFNLVYGSTFGANPCSDMGFADVMSLEYSTDGGLTWINITTYTAFAYDNWTLIQEVVPAGAQTANTIFRLWQPNNGGLNADNWAIDDFLLELDCAGLGCTQYSYLWTPATNISDVTSASPYFYPNVSTHYSVSISPEGFNCNSAADSILISVDELDISISPSDTFLCVPNTSILLEAEISGFSAGCESDYAVSQIPLNMLSGTPTNISLGDDAMSATITIPFDLEFYCEQKSSFAISSNGFISFSSLDNGCCSGENLPTANAFNPNDVIALMWSDLNPNNGGTISHFVTGTTPNRVQVVEFINIPHFGGSGATVSGQIQMFEYSNIVEIHCQDCQDDNGIITMGLENSAGDIGHTPPGYNAASWSSTNEAWRFVPTNSPANFQFGWTPNTAMTNDSILNPIVSPASSTDYIFNVYNINNCLFSDTAEIGIFESIATLSNDVSACFGDSIPLVATGADTYAWTSSNAMNNTLNDTSISNPMSGSNVDVTYYVTYNTQGCEEVDSVSIDILNLPSGIINNNINPVKFCEGETAELFVDNLNGWSFEWEDENQNTLGSNASVFVSEAGTYSISYNDGTCDNTTNVVVEENALPIIDFTDVENILCCTDHDEEVIFTNYVTNVSIGEVYINGVLETNPSLTYFSKDENFVQLDHYRVVSTDGCEAEADLSIATKCLELSFPNDNVHNPDTVYVNTPATFDVNSYDTGADIYTYTWSTTEPGDAIADQNSEVATFNGATPDEILTYTATVDVVATYGSTPCPAESLSIDYAVIELKDPLYPDAFTPNGDGTNDYYSPIINILAKTTELRIYNRWGDLVYDLANDSEKLGWDGKWNSVDQPSDLYLFYSKTVHPDGREFLQEGSVSLIR